MSCDNSIRQYNKAGAIDNSEATAISFFNAGTSTVVINGFPLAPNNCLSFSPVKCAEDCTKYMASFINNGSQTNSLFVFKGASTMQLSSMLQASASPASNVNIHDASGNNLNSTSGQLNVLDSTASGYLSTIATTVAGLATALAQTTGNTTLTNILSQNTLAVGGGGSKVLTAPFAGTSLSIKAFQVITAATITVFKVATVDQRVAYGLDAATIGVSAYIASPTGTLITDITLTVGQIVVYF